MADESVYDSAIWIKHEAILRHGLMGHRALVLTSTVDVTPNFKMNNMHVNSSIVE